MAGDKPLEQVVADDLRSTLRAGYSDVAVLAAHDYRDPIGRLILSDGGRGVVEGLRDGSLYFDPAFEELPDGTVRLVEISLVPSAGQSEVAQPEPVRESTNVFTLPEGYWGEAGRYSVAASETRRPGEKDEERWVRLRKRDVEAF